MAHSHYHRLRRPGSIEDLRIRVWRAVDAAEQTIERAMESPDQIDRVARALHAAIAVYREYRTLLQDAEIELRLQAIEKEFEDKKAFLALSN